MCANQGVRNISFTENFVYVLNDSCRRFYGGKTESHEISEGSLKKMWENSCISYEWAIHTMYIFSF